MKSDTEKAQKLARDISKVLAKGRCTFGEMWFAFAINISFLLAEMPREDRTLGYTDLINRIEEMIAAAKADGIKGVELPRRDH